MIRDIVLPGGRLQQVWSPHYEAIKEDVKIAIATALVQYIVRMQPATILSMIGRSCMPTALRVEGAMRFFAIQEAVIPRAALYPIV
jgi:hypothetical protein